MVAFERLEFYSSLLFTKLEKMLQVKGGHQQKQDASINNTLLPFVFKLLSFPKFSVEPSELH